MALPCWEGRGEIARRRRTADPSRVLIPVLALTYRRNRVDGEHRCRDGCATAGLAFDVDATGHCWVAVDGHRRNVPDPRAIGVPLRLILARRARIPRRWIADDRRDDDSAHGNSAGVYSSPRQVDRDVGDRFVVIYAEVVVAQIRRCR